VPNETVDVNVHPSKLEVRFANEKAIYDCIYYGVKNALSRDEERPQVDLGKVTGTRFAKPQVFTPEKAEQISFQPKKTEEVKPFTPPVKKSEPVMRQPVVAYNPQPQTDTFVPKPKITVYTPPQEEKKEVIPVIEKKITEEEIPIVKTEEVKTEVIQIKEEVKIPDFRIIGEAFKTYIFVECEGKMMIIDKHAAHERMIYNELKNRTDGIYMQSLMIPVTVTLSKEEYDVIINNLDLLEKAGFSVESFGTGSVIVRECPSVIEANDIESILTETAGYLMHNKNELISEKLDWIFHSSACRAAIKAGDKTNPYELEKFTEKLLSDDSVRYCPHGRPVLAELTKRELEKFFGRIQ